MQPWPRHPRRSRTGPSIATVALVGLWLALGSGIPTASASTSHPGPAAHAGHRCECGMDCGSTCCCAPKPGPEPRAAESPGKPPASGLAQGPCVGPSPCGGALPPGSGPMSRLGESADRADHAGPPPAGPGSLLAPPASDRAEAIPGSRMDEPPERPDAA